MGSSISAMAGARERRTLADVSPTPAKADLKPQDGASRLREVAAEALRANGKQMAAAAEIGIHEARLSHKLKDGSLTLAQLELLGPDYAARLGADLVRQFGPLSDPKDYIREQIRAIRRSLDEVAQFVESK